MIAIAVLVVVNLILHPNSHHAMATLLSGLGNDGRRKRLKLLPHSFIPPLTQGSASSPDSSSGACAAKIKL